MRVTEVERRPGSPLSAAALETAGKIARLDGLPSLPEVLVDLLDAISDESVSMDRVVSRLELDPALCSKILKLVNSAFYGFPRRIASLHRAVVLLGFNTIKQVALGATVMDLFDGRSTGDFHPHALWSHSVDCGTYASVLGAALGVRDSDTLFVAGLLHDVGKLALREAVPDLFQEALRDLGRAGGPLFEAERRVLGFDHAEAGALLARAWGFPERMALLFRVHHLPPPAVRLPPELEDHAYLLFASNLLAHRLLAPDEPGTFSGGAGKWGDEDWREVENLLAFWGVSPAQRCQMETEVRRRGDGAREALGVPAL
ncbi:MAG: HDOD domain-containing protein [Planctomycetes bacterium]|nr:HDOD domain-containing protein [Planctomycetota bacterium]